MNKNIVQRNQERNVARETSQRARPLLAPMVDVFENDNELLIVADLPGVEPGGVKVRLDRGELALEAYRKEEPEGRILTGDRGSFDYARRFQLPGGIDADKIDAKLDGGVLYLHLPKAESHKPREIPIKAR
jgi:HSP20 family molecular chaperone IbpA